MEIRRCPCAAVSSDIILVPDIILGACRAISSPQNGRKDRESINAAYAGMEPGEGVECGKAVIDGGGLGLEGGKEPRAPIEKGDPRENAHD